MQGGFVLELDTAPPVSELLTQVRTDNQLIVKLDLNKPADVSGYVVDSSGRKFTGSAVNDTLVFNLPGFLRIQTLTVSSVDDLLNASLTEFSLNPKPSIVYGPVITKKTSDAFPATIERGFTNPEWVPDEYRVILRR